MAEQSGISWTDATFNPWIGCTKVSAWLKAHGYTMHVSIRGDVALKRKPPTPTEI